MQEASNEFPRNVSAYPTLPIRSRMAHGGFFSFTVSPDEPGEFAAAIAGITRAKPLS
jgi:hypothetical protein